MESTNSLIQGEEKKQGRVGSVGTKEVLNNIIIGRMK